jgi:hypothetical protein
VTDDGSLQTAVDTARERVAAERERTTAKREAVDEFQRRVREVDPEPLGGTDSAGTPGPGSGAPGVGPQRGASGTQSRVGGGGSGCRAVRRAFADCLGDVAGDADERHDTVHEAIAAEFSEEVAVALATADGGGRLTPTLRAGVLDETRRRRAELSVMASALEREAGSLAAAAELVGETTDWLREHNPTPLSSLSFDELAARHRRLDDHRDRLDRAVAARQSFLDESTGEAARVGIRHEDLVAYLYGGRDTGHPVLVTLGRLDGLCDEAQRTLRAHLVCRA